MSVPSPDINVINTQNNNLNNLLSTLKGSNVKQDRIAHYLTNDVNFYKNINFLLLCIYFVLASIYSNFIFFNTYYPTDSRINILIQVILTIVIFIYPYLIMYLEKKILNLFF